MNSSPSTPEIQRRRLWLATVAVVVVLVDQATKAWALVRLEGQTPIELVGGLQLSFVYNRGVAFGLGQGVAPILVAVVLLGLVIFVLRSDLVATRAGSSAAGLLLGGGLGNLGDRLFRSEAAVVDFIDFGWWPVFNLADVAVVVGAGLLLVASSRRGELSA